MSLQESFEPGTKPLHPSTKQRVKAVRLGLSLDVWAVLAAIVLAIIVRFGAKISW